MRELQTLQRKEQERFVRINPVLTGQPEKENERYIGLNLMINPAHTRVLFPKLTCYLKPQDLLPSPLKFSSPDDSKHVIIFNTFDLS